MSAADWVYFGGGALCGLMIGVFVMAIPLHYAEMRIMRLMARAALSKSNPEGA